MASNSMNSSPLPQQKLHVVLFPFMSKGHTIPLLRLAHLLLRRHISVTVFTTTANVSFITDSLSDTSASIIALPFPDNIPGIPAGVESTDSLLSMSLFNTFAMATELMKPDFEKALQNLLPHVSFLVSDGFLWWTLDSAAKFGIPRFVSYGMSNYAMAVSMDVAVTQVLMSPHIGQDDPVTVTSFPWIKVNKNDLPPVFQGPEIADPVDNEFVMKLSEATSKSSGVIVNSFYEIEAPFADYWDKKFGPKSYYVGPLCLAYEIISDQPSKAAKGDNRDLVHRWLDQKPDGSDVLYVAFGTQAEISPPQIKEVAKGLEESEVMFMWVMRKKEQMNQLPDGFKERVSNRGIVIREWVDQRKILKHERVKGFLSHCGWNSVLESITAEVPILAWPMMAEQPLNVKMVVEEMKVGLRVEQNSDGLVKWEDLTEKVKELMEGEKGKEVRKKVKQVADIARKAVEEGGSSWLALEKLIDQACKDDASKSGQD